MMYWLNDNGRAPTRQLAGEDCIPFDPAILAVVEIGGRWKVVEGTHWLLEHQLQGGLHDPVCGRRDPQRADLAARFGDRPLPHPPGTNRRALRSSRSPPSSSPAPNTIERGAMPSMPAVRAPLLPRTRLHATTRNAGSYTRLSIGHRNDGQDQPSPIGAASSASRVPATRPRRGRATERRCSPAASSVSVDAANTLDPFAMCAAFPCLGLLRVLRPIPAASAGDGPSRRPAGCWPGRGPPGWFPRSLSNLSTGSAPSYAPAASPRLRRRPSPWPPGRRHHPAEEFPATTCGVRAAAQPRSARFELVALLRGVQSLVPHVRLSVLLAGPGPSGSAGPSRRCQGCFHPPPRPGDQAALSFNAPAATSRWRCPFTTARFESASWRSMSHAHNWLGPVATSSGLTVAGRRALGSPFPDLGPLAQEPVHGGDRGRGRCLHPAGWPRSGRGLVAEPL